MSIAQVVHLLAVPGSGKTGRRWQQSLDCGVAVQRWQFTEVWAQGLDKETRKCCGTKEFGTALTVESPGVQVTRLGDHVREVQGICSAALIQSSQRHPGVRNLSKNKWLEGSFFS